MAQTFLERRSETLAALPEWQKLLEHFELSDDSFAYIPLLVQDDSWSEICEKNLSGYFSARKKKLLKLNFTDAEEFKNLAVKLFDLKFTADIGAVWISAPIVFRQEQIDIWQEAWREATARLNQYRNPLREKFPVTFIFAGGFRSQEVTRTMAPDLWSIRTTVIRIEPAVEEILNNDRGIETLGTIETEQTFDEGSHADPDYALKEAKRLRNKKGAEITAANLFYRAAESFHTYGRLPEAQKTIKEAIKIYRRFKLERELANSLNLDGIILKDSGKLVDAIKIYEKAEKIYLRFNSADDIAGVYLNKGVALRNLGRLNEAIEEYDKATSILKSLVEDGRRELTNELAMTYLNKGVALRNLGRLNEAIEEYDKATSILKSLVEDGRRELTNELAMTYLNKGSALYSLKRLNEAIEEYDKSIGIRKLSVEEGRRELSNDLAKSYWGKGLALADLNKTEDAIKKYSKAIKLFDECLERKETQVLPNLFTVLYLRIIVLIKIKDWQSVAEDVRRALNLQTEISRYKDFSEHFKNQIADRLQAIIQLIREVPLRERKKIYKFAGVDGEAIRELVESTNIE